MMNGLERKSKKIDPWPDSIPLPVDYFLTEENGWNSKR
jgi:hypothetical protein